MENFFFLVPNTNTFMVKSLRKKHSYIRLTCIKAAKSKLMKIKLLSIINTDPNILNEALKILLEDQFRIKPYIRQV